MEREILTCHLALGSRGPQPSDANGIHRMPSLDRHPGGGTKRLQRVIGQGRISRWECKKLTILFSIAHQRFGNGHDCDLDCLNTSSADQQAKPLRSSREGVKVFNSFLKLSLLFSLSFTRR